MRNGPEFCHETKRNATHCLTTLNGHHYGEAADAYEKEGDISIRHIAECFYTKSFKTNERAIAIALADYADDFGRCWPSLANIAAKTGYSRRQTSRIVQQLVALGYVEIETDATLTSTPTYRLHPEVLEKPTSD